MQERCLKRIVGRVMFIEGLTSEQATQTVADFTGNHPEPQLIAFAFGELTRMGFLGIKTEAEKYFVLAAVNLLECICEAAKSSCPAKGGTRPASHGSGWEPRTASGSPAHITPWVREAA